MWISWRMRWWSWMWFKQGQIEVDGEDESDCESGECGDACGDGYGKNFKLTAIPHPLPHPPLHPIPNQSKPIVPIPSLSLL